MNPCFPPYPTCPCACGREGTPRTAHVANGSLGFRVQDDPCKKHYTLTNIRAKGFDVRAEGTPIGIATADQWEWITQGEHAGWWGSTNHADGTTSTLISEPFTLKRHGTLRFSWHVMEYYFSSLRYVVANTEGFMVYSASIRGETEVFDVSLALPAGTYTVTFTYYNENFWPYPEQSGYVQHLRVHDGAPMGIVIVEWPMGLHPQHPVNGLQRGWLVEAATQTSVRYRTPENNDTASLIAFLRSLRFAYEVPVQGCIRVRVFTAGSTPNFFDEDGHQHYCMYINRSTSWLQAYNQAKQMTVHGLNGVLMSCPSLAIDRLMQTLPGAAQGWISGTRLRLKSGERIANPPYVSGDADAYDLDGDQWYWSCGDQAGTVFSSGKTWPAELSPFAYAHWYREQPDNAKGDEAVMIRVVGYTYGSWSDESLSEGKYGFYAQFSTVHGQTDQDELRVCAPLPPICCRPGC